MPEIPKLGTCKYINTIKQIISSYLSQPKAQNRIKMEGLSLPEARKTEARTSTSLSKIVKKIALTSKGHSTVYILCSSKQSGPVLEDDEYW